MEPAGGHCHAAVSITMPLPWVCFIRAPGSLLNPVQVYLEALQSPSSSLSWRSIEMSLQLIMSTMRRPAIEPLDQNPLRKSKQKKRGRLSMHRDANIRHICPFLQCIKELRSIGLTYYALMNLYAFKGNYFTPKNAILSSFYQPHIVPCWFCFFHTRRFCNDIRMRK